MTEAVTITIDGRPVKVPADQLLIAVAEDNGTYIPRFCWHRRMKPVGMCRMCLVEIETPRGPLLTTACTTTVSEGMAVITASDVVRKAQEGVLEFLLINHPLDCPVCDRGGECPLQDQTMAHGPGESRFVEEKRHFSKPISISDLVLLDRERCILCARCTRFSDEVSGDPLIEFIDRAYGTQVNTFPDEPFASYFSGNTVQICPVGALTAVPYRFRARPWDLTSVESTCPHCVVGCRISVQASQNQVLRFLGVDNEPTNQGWLSDKCRFGFEYVNSPDRLTTPLIRNGDGGFSETTWSDALGLVASRLSEIIASHGESAVAAIGGARGTNEDAYALAKFMRVAVRSNHVDAQLDDGLEPGFLAGVTPRAKIADLDDAKTILLWGPDLKEEIGTLYLRVRHAVQEQGARLVVLHPRRTGLDDKAEFRFIYRPGQGSAVLAKLAVGQGEFADARAALAEGGVVALVGRTGLTEDRRLAESVAAFARDDLGARIMPLVRRSNTYGALDMGLAPTLLPGRASIEQGRGSLTEGWGELPEGPGRETAGMLLGLVTGDIKALVLAGADPVSDVPDGGLAKQALEAADFIVALDLFLTDSSRLADVILPAKAFTEKEGTVTNLEGRVQKVNQLIAGPGQVRAECDIFDEIASRMGRPIGLPSAGAAQKEVAVLASAYEGLTWDFLDEQREGVVVPAAGAAQPFEFLPVWHELPATAAPMVLHLARTLYDDGVTISKSPTLGKLAPGGAAWLHPDEASALGLEQGELVRLRGQTTEIELPVELDPSLLPGVVYVPFNQPETPPLGTDLELTVAKAGVH
ncbi:MAG: NADH-quinone oxidoreductase subunit NuoG [Acidimicrobiia bacterium]